MSKKRTSTISRPKTDWGQVGALTDEQVRSAIEADPDAHPTDESFWKTAQVVMPRPKETITIRLDADVLEWFRGKGKGYQTRINAILRSYMRAREDGDVSGD
ncbi:MAG: BrnA antitoxin family protein [Acidobacteriota bacterium]|nr:MAG: BrnA antitoxin family protein [Acidobacteriota bacterium]